MSAGAAEGHADGAVLRDTLLPKLISGNIRATDSEKKVAETLE